ncbi:MAG: InlB B-repeat-containing protein, partial [Coriobacteriia bacterium]|nr:InlB B-repeat-containing protein [Coriobacteriia bacterium]
MLVFALVMPHGVAIATDTAANGETPVQEESPNNTEAQEQNVKAKQDKAEQLKEAVEETAPIALNNVKTRQASYDPESQKINGFYWGTLAKSSDGKYYFAPVKGNSNDDREHADELYEIDQATYEAAVSDSMVTMKRIDGQAFKMYSSFRDATSTDAYIENKNVTIVQVDFHFHDAFSNLFLQNNFVRASEVPSNKDVEWSLTLNKDWVIEHTEYFGNPGATSAFISLEFFGVVDGQGHKIYSNNSEKDLLMRIEKPILREIDPDENTKLVLKNITLDGNGSKTGIVTAEGTHLSLEEGTTIQNCYKEGSNTGGGALIVGHEINAMRDYKTLVSMSGGAIIENSVSKTDFGGGAIGFVNEQCELNINGGTIRNCSSENYGGAISSLHDGNIININNANIHNNTAVKQGGALAVFDGIVRVSNSTFTENSSKESSGGAIYITKPKETVSIDASAFTKNSGKYGGAVYLNQASSIIGSSSFTDNSATKDGGAVCLYYSAGKITESKFSDNSAASLGGAVYTKFKDFEISGSEFNGNKADLSNGWGGAIYANKEAGDKFSISDSTFTANSGAFGGALTLLGSLNKEDSLISNTTFENNFAVKQGGAALFRTNANIDSSSIQNNGVSENGDVTTFGGGILTDKDADLSISKSFIKNNEAIFGGGIYAISSTVDFSNTAFNDNTAVCGGGAYATASVINFSAVAFKDNVAKTLKDDASNNDESNGSLGGALYLKKDANASISNKSQFTNNKANWGGAIFTELNSLEDPIPLSNPLAATDPYQNLTIDKTTTFKANLGHQGLFVPPSNYAKFENLAFSDDSDVLHHENQKYKSLLNNYDVYYKGKKVEETVTTPDNLLTITYDANGGRFADGTTIKTFKYAKGTKIEIIDAPERAGYIFDYWKGSKYLPGDSYTVV